MLRADTIRYVQIQPMRRARLIDHSTSSNSEYLVNCWSHVQTHARAQTVTAPLVYGARALTTRSLASDRRGPLAAPLTKYYPV